MAWSTCLQHRCTEHVDWYLPDVHPHVDSPFCLGHPFTYFLSLEHLRAVADLHLSTQTPAPEGALGCLLTSGGHLRRASLLQCSFTGTVLWVLLSRAPCHLPSGPHLSHSENFRVPCPQVSGGAQYTCLLSKWRDAILKDVVNPSVNLVVVN